MSHVLTAPTDSAQTANPPEAAPVLSVEALQKPVWKIKTHSLPLLKHNKQQSLIQNQAIPVVSKAIPSV
jgi:hypothetical protein